MSAPHITPTPLTDATAPANESPTVLHMVGKNDILMGQVYGIPAVALCGHTFVPASGGATSGGGTSVVCDSCDTLWKIGVRTPPVV